jgi:hypothetical protein
MVVTVAHNLSLPNGDRDDGDGREPPEVPDDYQEPEFPVLLTPGEAQAAVDGLRGWVRFQAREDPRTAAQTPEPDSDPWPGDMAAVADKVELALREWRDG